jgi:hypothetical protein
MEPFMEPSGSRRAFETGEMTPLCDLPARQPSVPARQIAFIEARCDGRLELRLAAFGRDPDSQA